MTILLIEDDRRISDFVIKGLEEHGYVVTLAETGEAARELVREHEWDIILMDIMLPGIDGVQLTSLIRFKKIYTPILVLSALGDAEDKIRALDSGADDYLTKPFHFPELLSRINAMIRRSKFNFESKETLYTCHDLIVNVEEHAVRRQGKMIKVSSREFKILLLLIEHQNKIVTRTQILTSVWGIQYDTNTNLVDVYISYLRNKIDADFDVPLIHTIKGAGYVLRYEPSGR